jgi:nicotinamide-nucleotide amidase
MARRRVASDLGAAVECAGAGVPRRLGLNTQPASPGLMTPPTDQELLDLARRVGAACREHGVRLGTAESCTGGLVGHLITEVPGSSDYFAGAVVTYANELKVALADVPGPVLEAHGAVSAQVARAMADGARRRLGVDVAIAVTGVAGPDGGSAAKPVGLTYVAIADPAGDDVRRFVWDGDRSGNKRLSAAAALELVVERLTGSSS